MDINVLFKKFMEDPEFAKMYWDLLKELKQELQINSINSKNKLNKRKMK